MERAVRLLAGSYLSAYTAVLQARGVDIKPLLKASGLPASLLESPTPIVSATPVHQFIKCTHQLSEPGELSLAAGFHHATHEPNPFRAGLVGSVTVAEAVRRHNELVPEYSPWNQFALDDGRTEVRWHKLGRSPLAETEVFCVANMIGHIRTILGHGWLPRRIEVSVAPLSMFKTLGLPDERLAISKTNTTIVIPAYELPARVASKCSPSTPGPFSGKPDFLESLRLALRDYAKSGEMTIAVAAKLARMSSRTLQRRLTAHDLTFSQLIDQVRYRLACDLMQQSPDLNITAIGVEVGYRDAGSFSRAFRRFAGMPPREYRVMFKTEDAIDIR